MRAAEHVACGHELDADIADLERLSIGERLCAAPRRAAEPQLHHAKRFLGRKHVIMAVPRMIGMAVRDDGALHRTTWVDVESARPAIETAAIGGKPSFEAIGFHGDCVEQITENVVSSLSCSA